jgi:hypothetical protein
MLKQLLVAHQASMELVVHLIEAAYFVFWQKFIQFYQQIFPLLLVLQSDLANLVNIAAIKAAVEGAEKLTAAQLEFAKDRILMGTERKTMFISEESKKVCINQSIGNL